MGSSRAREPLSLSAQYARLDIHLSSQRLKRVGLQALPRKIGWHAATSRPPGTACTTAKNGSLATKVRNLMHDAFGPALTSAKSNACAFDAHRKVECIPAR